MMPPLNNTINSAAQVIIALCAVGALCLSFWKAPKPVNEKLAILLTLVDLSSFAALLATGYLMAFTDRTGLVAVFSLYYLIVRYAMFAVSPLTRLTILTLVTAAVFAGTASFFQLQKVSLIAIGKVQSEMIKQDAAMVDNESKIVSILQRIPIPPASP
jgi:hypothetical protein